MCRFGENYIKYLGHKTGNGIVQMDPSKIISASTSLAPIYIKEIQKFIGLANCYNEFIPGFVTMVTS